jgi:hypothetical protein
VKRPVRDPDPALRRFERDAAIACGAMACAALVLGRGRPDLAAGVVAGGCLMALSYLAIKGGVDVLVGAVSRPGPLAGAADDGAADAPDDGADTQVPGTRARRVALAVKFFTRYALLAVGAYVMLTCFRLHPVGLLAGATSPFVAAVAQVVRMSRAAARREHP